MKKIFNYFIQSIFIYLFFLIGFILRLKISRKLFSIIFVLVGPLVKSKKIIKNNFNICAKKISKFDENKIEYLLHTTFLIQNNEEDISQGEIFFLN